MTSIFDVMLLTNNPKLASMADELQISRIFIDLEIIGKHARQGHLNTHITTHEIQDISTVRRVLKNTKLLVRVNPIGVHSKDEINQVIEAGADIVMLPMFTTAEEVDYFVRIINRRVKVCLLLETPQALARLEEILRIDGIDEIHIGLNDLSLGLGLNFMFEILSGGLLDYLSNHIIKKGIKFGFGGIARIDEGDLPASLVIKEHVRLQSTMAILSRTFLKERDANISITKAELSHEISEIQNAYSNAFQRTSEEMKVDQKKAVKIIKQISSRK